MSKVEELIAESKLNELLKKKDDEKVKKTVIWVLAIVGAVAADGSDRICGILLLYTGLSGRF